MLIPESDAAEFIALYVGLLYYAGGSRGIIPDDMSFDEFLDEPTEVKVDCRDALYEPRPMFNEFLEDNADQMSAEQQEIVRAWNDRYVRGKFVVLQHLKQHAIFLSTDSSPKAYAVLGLTTELSDMAPKAYLPLLMETTLLPYKDMIVCDGLVRISPVLIGHSMTRNMKAEYAEIKRAGGLITAL
ncbi:MAG TPA: hypothetical protein VJ183_14220 [Chloroflexia bacterium]|nr:hypothetical protein [Chloroflexia bacterium]